MFFRPAIRRALVLVATLLLSAAAHAQLFRAYLAPSGSDANPCTLPAPCRLLPAALAAVANGGEIWLLDSANYNTATVNITKSVTILAVPGAVGSVLAIGGPAISIATAGVIVALRNLVIVPLPGSSATDGITMTNGSRLLVDSCQIANIPAFGITVNAAAAVHIIDSVVRDGFGGIYLTGGATAVIASTKILGNSFRGIMIYGSAGTVTTASISDTVSSNSNIGIVAWSGTTGTARASITHATFSNNTYGVVVDAGSGTQVITIGNSLVTGNAVYGLWKAAGSGTSTLYTLGNNNVDQNGTNLVGTTTPGSSL